MSKRTDHEYMHWDAFAGDKDGGDTRCRTVAIVKTRKIRTCLCFPEPHAIPIGQRVRLEKSIYEGKWRSWYSCLECIDKDLDEWDA